MLYSPEIANICASRMSMVFYTIYIYIYVDNSNLSNRI